MDKLKPFLYKHGYRLLRIYWFFRRPTTQGVRCVVVHGDTVLLVKHTYGSAYWTTVGGGIQSGESLEQAVVREVHEEVGLVLDNAFKIGEVFHEQEYKKDTVHVFLGFTSQPDVRLDKAEIASAKWVSIKNLPNDVSPLFRKFFNLAQPHLK